MSAPVLKLGVAGIGRAFSFMIPTFRDDPRVIIAAGFDPREEARSRFTQDFGAPAFASMEELCATDVDAIYIASPHQFHAPQVAMAAAHGKHVLVEKPIAATVADAQRMIDAGKANNRVLMVGQVERFNPAVEAVQRAMAARNAPAAPAGLPCTRNRRVHAAVRTHTP
jgi:phthalate 4,5-cis-dihydrodiol dehydrogenase